MGALKILKLKRSESSQRENDWKMDELDAKLSFERHLRKELQGSGITGEAFKQVCNAGYDREELEKDVLHTSSLDFERSKQMYTAKDAKRVQALAEKIAQAGEELMDVGTEFPMLAPVYPRLRTDAFMLLAIGETLRAAGRNPKLRGFMSLTATQWLPHFLSKVEERTGRPHFAEMATLIGAAFGQPEFSEEDLKMRVHRSSRTRRTRE